MYICTYYTRLFPTFDGCVAQAPGCCWCCIVAVLSLPSVAFALVAAIPSNNTLQFSAPWLF